MSQIGAENFAVGKKFDLGAIALSEKEIVEFALAFDPLDFHTNKAVAEKSIFKGIVASGPHIFTLIHRIKWIPLFGHTVICGLELNNWKFLKPLYPDQNVHGSVTIKLVQPVPEKKYMIVKWLYEFKDDKGDMMQSLEMTISHKFRIA